ncbi:MAG: FapA family protein, partial [Clostridiales bacterium]|nr:FapA family protein [Clostridiales bacterium]
MAEYTHQNSIDIDLRVDGLYVVINNANPLGKITKKHVLDLVNEYQIKEVDLSAVNTIFEKAFLHIEQKITNNKQIAVKDETVRVAVSPDKMTAQIRFVKASPGGKAVTYDQVLSALLQAEVRYGVDTPAIESAVAEKAAGKEYTVARGIASVEGKDGYLEYLFGVSGKSVKPKITDDGRADFHALHMFEPVEKGQTL